MALLNNEIIEHVKNELAEQSEPVTLLVFTREEDCTYCDETQGLAEEIAALADWIDVKVYDMNETPEKAEEYGVDKAPAIAITGAEDYGVRFYGIPSGYEFTSLIQAIKSVSSGESSLSAETIEFLESLEEPLHLQVFVTPTCPYCPQAVVLGHQMAIVSDKVRSDMVEANEFPQLSAHYEVRGVPRTIINETEAIEGAAPEPMLVERLRGALTPAQP